MVRFSKAHIPRDLSKYCTSASLCGGEIQKGRGNGLGSHVYIL